MDNLNFASGIAANWNPPNNLYKPMEPAFYLPELWTIKKDDIYAAMDCLEKNVRYLNQLIRMERILLQTDPDDMKAKLFIRQLEKDLTSTERSLESLKQYGPDKTPSNED